MDLQSLVNIYGKKNNNNNNSINSNNNMRQTQQQPPSMKMGLLPTPSYPFPQPQPPLQQYQQTTQLQQQQQFGNNALLPTPTNVTPFYGNSNFHQQWNYPQQHQTAYPPQQQFVNSSNPTFPLTVNYF